MRQKSRYVLLMILLTITTAMRNKAVAQGGTPATNPKTLSDGAVLSPTDVASAEQLFRAGKFAEAEAVYQALLKSDPKFVPAQVGLVLTMLRQQKIDESLDVVNAAISAEPNSAALAAAKGDIHFRRGEMEDAEAAYLAGNKLDAKEVRAHLGLAKLYLSYSLYGKAYDQLRIARDLAPNNLDVQRAWLMMLPRKERVAAIEAFLAGTSQGDERDTQRLKEYLEFLKATADKPIHGCKLASKVEQTATKLEIMYEDSRRMRGLGLAVRINGQKARLLLDTGAGGIVVGRNLAEKAGLTRVSSGHYGGIGDKGWQNSYTAIADHIQIGELQFEDCVVSVSEKGSITDEDGLIGADVFGAYLIDIDFPGMRLKLSPLPKRPEDTVAPTSLNTEEADQATAEQTESGASEWRGNPKQISNATPSVVRPPRDRYVAPEMATWTKVFRFGHTLLVPTMVNGSKPMLLMLDTGAFNNVLSIRAGRQVSKVGSEDRVRVRGLSGPVDKVYSSDKATLRFGHLQQANVNMITLDLSTLSRHTGTEVSGFLGFGMLRLLTVKLDYRDGLVNFEYDPKHLPARMP